MPLSACTTATRAHDRHSWDEVRLERSRHIEGALENAFGGLEGGDAIVKLGQAGEALQDVALDAGADMKGGKQLALAHREAVRRELALFRSRLALKVALKVVQIIWHAKLGIVLRSPSVAPESVEVFLAGFLLFRDCVLCLRELLVDVLRL